jgi:hypothetical protein
VAPATMERRLRNQNGLWKISEIFGRTTGESKNFRASALTVVRMLLWSHLLITGKQ